MAAKPATVRTVRALRKQVQAWRGRKQTVALVPTMGALHEGHLSLVRLAKESAKRVVVSIFVNPTQFAPHEDFDAYPREEAKDRKKLVALGVDLIYAPPAKEMYPPGFSTRVVVGGVSECLDGASRPHFFGGVATVVAKLLQQCQPDMAVFGEKDYQQIKVIERMVRDLDMPVKILGGPIVREEDGLALSSRNAYLTPEERLIAPLLNRTLTDVAADIAEGRPIEDAIGAGRQRLDHAGFAVDYVEARDARDLAPLEDGFTQAGRVFGASYLGRTRLIDNVPIPKKRKAKPKPEVTADQAR